MIIEKINNMTVLYSEGDKKITNSEMSFFSNLVYIGKNDNVSNYKEVDYDVWRNNLTDFIPSNEGEEIKKEIEALKEENLLLGDLLLETDYRLLQIELFGLNPEF